MSVEIANDSNFAELLKTNNKIIVKFYADWCGNCRLFSPKFKRLSNDERFADVIFLDINAEENPEARKAGMVNNLPHFATFKDGKFFQSQATSKEEAVVELLTAL